MKIYLVDGACFNLLRVRLSGPNKEYIHIEIAKENYLEVITAFSNTDNISSMLVKSDSDIVQGKYDGYTKNISIYKDFYRNVSNEVIERITLEFERADYVEDINSIKQQICELRSIVIPEEGFDAMSVDEYRAYKKKTIGDECSNTILEGIDFEINGVLEHFSFYDEDQKNFIIGKQNCDDGYQYIVYHNSSTSGSTHEYKLYEAKVFEDIYNAQNLNRIDLSCRCNAIFVWLDHIYTKEEMKDITFSSPIPDAYKENYDYIVNTTKSMIEQIKEEKNKVSETA